MLLSRVGAAANAASALAGAGRRMATCGGGGGAPITDIPGKQRIPDMRMEDIRETGAELGRTDQGPRVHAATVSEPAGPRKPSPPALHSAALAVCAGAAFAAS